MSTRASPAPRLSLGAGTEPPTSLPTTGPVVALVRDPHLARWIRNELAYLGQSHEAVATVPELAAWAANRLATPRLLIISVDELEAGELCSLRRVREGGFTGPLVGLSRSRLQASLRIALGISVMLTAPFVQDLLADLLRPE